MHFACTDVILLRGGHRHVLATCGDLKGGENRNTNIIIMLKNKRPTWCHLLFYFNSYVLNMFQTLIYPSSGACDYSVELPHWLYCSWFDVCWEFRCGWVRMVSVLQAYHQELATILLSYHIGRIVLGSMCVGVSVWLGWSGIRVAGWSLCLLDRASLW